MIFGKLATLKRGWLDSMDKCQERETVRETAVHPGQTREQEGTGI